MVYACVYIERKTERKIGKMFHKCIYMCAITVYYNVYTSTYMNGKCIHICMSTYGYKQTVVLFECLLVCLERGVRS